MKNQDNNEFIKRLIPFSLCAVVIILDQITKFLIVKNIPPYTMMWSFWDGFVNIVHVRNPGVAFSMGASWPLWMRKIIFSVLPLVVIAYVIKIYFRNNEITDLQRWCICAVIGGGIGNLIDRIFRPSGVVDFVDVKWFGIEESPLKFFRMQRWPTFNVADAAVVVFGIILICTFIAMIAAENKKEKQAKKK